MVVKFRTDNAIKNHWNWTMRRKLEAEENSTSFSKKRISSHEPQNNSCSILPCFTESSNVYDEKLVEIANLECDNLATNSANLTCTSKKDEVLTKVETLPFGGVGDSGIGHYHSKYTFECFSHKKSVLVRDYFPLSEKLGDARYPLYNNNKIKNEKFLLIKRKSWNLSWIPYVAIFALGILTMYLIQYVIVANTNP